MCEWLHPSLQASQEKVNVCTWPCIHTLTFSVAPLWCVLQGLISEKPVCSFYTSYILYMSPRENSLVGSYKFTAITFVKPIFKERMKQCTKGNGSQILTDELMPSLIIVMYLIVCEAAGSSEHVEFWACVWSLTFFLFFKRMGSCPPTGDHTQYVLQGKVISALETTNVLHVQL